MPYKDTEKAKTYRREWMRRQRAKIKKAVDVSGHLVKALVLPDEEGYIAPFLIAANLKEVYCQACNKFLGHLSGIAELKCKCGKVNLISTNADIKIESASECQHNVDGMKTSASERLNTNIGGQYGTKSRDV